MAVGRSGALRRAALFSCAGVCGVAGGGGPTLGGVATLILLRHARSAANGSGTLAGRTAGVGLDETGRVQAEGLAGRLSGIPVSALVASPLQRCQDTVAGLAEKLGVPVAVEDRLAEVDYGQWTGRAVKDLTQEPLWKVVQQHPSAAVFPGGEALAQVQARAVEAVREHDRRISGEFGPHAVWVACSHGDVIKAVLADALGLHLDGFQRIVVDPCSVSVVRYTETRPFVLRVNDTGGDVSGLLPPKEEDSGSSSSDAVVGGSTGAGA
ncbi:histidine phosphatase family protein [Saccharopolyspora spinosporotrichia]|uniref:Histidine phosphatase family protein n=1 Tax=Saccharopolyspora erythraea TaxID=1836 RepID=A0ABP3NU92_SACER